MKKKTLGKTVWCGVDVNITYDTTFYFIDSSRIFVLNLEQNKLWQNCFFVVVVEHLKPAVRVYLKQPNLIWILIGLRCNKIDKIVVDHKRNATRFVIYDKQFHSSINENVQIMPEISKNHTYRLKNLYQTKS